MSEAPVLTTLRERASLQPDDVAFTFTHYDADWSGVTETLTWAQLYRRVDNLARAISSHGESGDRAVILANQSLDYIVAFLGSMLAGYIAVPLSAPYPGAHDERIGAVMADTSPAVVLTTSELVETVGEYLADTAGPVPTVVAVDDVAAAGRPAGAAVRRPLPEVAYLQYTSGSTRVPAGVMISHDNLYTNFRQLMADYFGPMNGVVPPGTNIVSWLPFYHDMGLVFAVVTPILGGYPSHLSSPMAFLQRPARWIQAMAAHDHAWSAAPNFAYELAAAKTSDDDMAGLDMSGVDGLLSGAERVHPATLKRFTDRFGKYNFRPEAFRPSYGLAEGTVYAATRTVGGPPKVSHFDADALSEGAAIAVQAPAGVGLISYGTPHSPEVRIVDPDALTESSAGAVGEIWLHGGNVAEGYWRKPDETAATFGGMLATPSEGTPPGPWLRTGDLGFMFDDELYIVGRMKDILIIRGRNLYPEDIESTVGEITGGRSAAITVSVGQDEKLVVIAEYKKRRPESSNAAQAADAIEALKSEVTSAISRVYGVTTADLVLVAPGSLPITTSGKIRRSACGDLYVAQQFARLDS